MLVVAVDPAMEGGAVLFLEIEETRDPLPELFCADTAGLWRPGVLVPEVVLTYVSVLTIADLITLVEGAGGREETVGDRFVTLGIVTWGVSEGLKRFTNTGTGTGTLISLNERDCFRDATAKRFT